MGSTSSGATLTKGPSRRYSDGRGGDVYTGWGFGEGRADSIGDS